MPENMNFKIFNPDARPTWGIILGPCRECEEVVFFGTRHARSGVTQICENCLEDLHGEFLETGGNNGESVCNPDSVTDYEFELWLNQC